MLSVIAVNAVKFDGPDDGEFRLELSPALVDEVLPDASQVAFGIVSSRGGIGVCAVEEVVIESIYPFVCPCNSELLVLEGCQNDGNLLDAKRLHQGRGDASHLFPPGIARKLWKGGKEFFASEASSVEDRIPVENHLAIVGEKVIEILVAISRHGYGSSVVEGHASANSQGRNSQNPHGQAGEEETYDVSFHCLHMIICVQKYDFLAFNAKKDTIYLQVKHKVSNFAPHFEVSDKIVNLKLSNCKRPWGISSAG